MGTTNDKAEFWTLIKTCKGKRYEDDTERWNKLLKLLGIPLRAQGILSRVIGEGRFAKAEKPEAYLAMATRRQAKDLNLYSDDPAKCELRGAVKGAELGPVSNLNLTRFDNPEGDDPASPHDLFVEWAQHKFNGHETESAWDGGEWAHYGHVPYWLRQPEEHFQNTGEMVDWGIVAKYAVVKPAMAEVVGYVLSLRATKEFKRDRITNEAKGRFSRQDIEAATKWVERNWDSRITPLFKMDQIPTSGEKSAQRAKSLSPSDALKLVIKREQGTYKFFHWY